MDWFIKHADTLAILGSFALCFWNMNEKFTNRFNDLDREIASIKTEIAVMKAVMIMKNIMPLELAIKEEGK